jgi:uncharacterized YigZ family protein
MSYRGRYPVPGDERRVSDEVKGSRFIASVGCAPDVEAARAFIARIKDEFADATHNCWAYVVGPPGSTDKNAASDDGEPGGTAGSPILNALLNSGVGDVVVVVTRYFGGVKLGRGGLVRAYGGGARRVLQVTPLVERITYTLAMVTVEYAAVDTIRRLIGEHDGVIVEETFGESAAFEAKVPEDRFADFESAAIDATHGKARVAETRRKDRRDESH